MDKLVFEIPKPENKPAAQRGTSLIRTSNEAIDLIDTVSMKTGKSRSYIADRMIKYAFENIEYI